MEDNKDVYFVLIVVLNLQKDINIVEYVVKRDDFNKNEVKSKLL